MTVFGGGGRHWPDGSPAQMGIAPPAGAPDPPQMGGEAPAETGDPLVVFLYLLLRDHVSPGAIEHCVLEIEGAPHESWTLSNAYLAGYAENVRSRLGRVHPLREVHANRLRAAENHVAALLRAPTMSERDRETDRIAAEGWLERNRGL